MDGTKQPQGVGHRIDLGGIATGLLEPFLGHQPVKSQVDQAEADMALAPIGPEPQRGRQCLAHPSSSQLDTSFVPTVAMRVPGEGRPAAASRSSTLVSRNPWAARTIATTTDPSHAREAPFARPNSDQSWREGRLHLRSARDERFGRTRRPP